MNQLNGQGRPRRSFRIKRSRKKNITDSIFNHDPDLFHSTVQN
jgi:hypothetical protein